jgi:hypothetical protein
LGVKNGAPNLPRENFTGAGFFGFLKIYDGEIQQIRPFLPFIWIYLNLLPCCMTNHHASKVVASEKTFRTGDGYSAQ